MPETTPNIAPPDINPDYLKSHEQMSGGMVDAAAELKRTNDLFAASLETSSEATDADLFLMFFKICVSAKVATTSPTIADFAQSCVDEYRKRYPKTPPTPTPAPAPGT